MKLTDKIKAWEQAKIISAYQGQAILEYERRIGHPKFFLSVVMLSIFSISIGIIAILTANWDSIPTMVKLSADMLLLIGLAIGIIYGQATHRKVLTEGLIWGYSLMIMASIGLIGQIYQLQGDIYSALSFWGVLSIPLVLMSSQVWFGVFWGLLSINAWFEFLRANTNWFGALINFWDKNYPIGGWLLLFVSILGIAKLLINRQEQLSKSLKILVYVYFIFVLINCDFGWFFRTSGLQASALIYGLMAIFMLVLIGFYRWCKNNKADIFMSQCLLILWGYGAIRELVPSDLLSHEVLGFMLTALILGQGIYHCLHHQLLRPANLLILLLALRIFVGFLQVFGNLINTGIGLIGAGIMFLLLGYMAKKFMVYNSPRGEHE